jgi:RNA polymerase sigma-70 factor (ECF subfamily)
MSQTGTCDRREWVLSILEQYECRLVRYATRLLGEEDSARDVVQFAFMRLCSESPEELQGREAQWMFTVCRNRAVDLIRRRRRTRSLEEMAAGPGIDKGPDPAVVAERHDLHARLRGLVAELPEAQREAIDLWTEGFSYREIAEITGNREGQLRVLVHRALKRLRGDPVVRRMVEFSGQSGRTFSTEPSGEVRT